MKQLTAPIKLLLLALFIIASLQTKAQCDDNCTYGPLKYSQFNLCTFSNPKVSWIWEDKTTTPSTFYPRTDVVANSPFVFVIIWYRIKTCPDGTKSAFIEDYIFVDNRQAWENEYFTDVQNPPVIPPSAQSACKYSVSNMQKAIDDAISQLLDIIGIQSQSYYNVFFKGACRSSVQLSFPDGAFFPGAADDNGHIDTFYLSSKDIIFQTVPCSDACCMASYEWKKINLGNGETISKWVPVSTKGDEEGCRNQPLPVVTPLEATILDPSTGNTKTVKGEIIGQKACELTCPSPVAPPPPSLLLKTDIEPNDIPLQFSANPTLVHNNIYFTTSKPISRVMIYEQNGKKIRKEFEFTNNELNLSELKQGMYYIQVYFDDNTVRTVKIAKQ